MESHKTLHTIAVILSILSIIAITYTQIFVRNFETPEATANFLRNSNTFYYISEIIKTRVRTNYTATLANNIVEGAIADRLLDLVVTPERVQTLLTPALRASSRIAQVPLEFSGQNLVLPTQQYTQQLSQTISSSQLPPPAIDAANNLIASVPSQITIVDAQKNPNSALLIINKLKVLMENARTILTISWIVLVISLLTLIFINLRTVKRLFNGLFWNFLISGIVIFLISYIGPAIADTTASLSADPITGVLKNEMIQNIISYYFSLTRDTSLILILLGIAFYLLYRFSKTDAIQQWVNTHLLSQTPQPATVSNPPTQPKNGRRRSKNQ